MIGVGLVKICLAKFEQNGQPKEWNNCASKMGCQFCQKSKMGKEWAWVSELEASSHFLLNYFYLRDRFREKWKQLAYRTICEWRKVNQGQSLLHAWPNGPQHCSHVSPWNGYGQTLHEVFSLFNCILSEYIHIRKNRNTIYAQILKYLKE